MRHEVLIEMSKSDLDAYAKVLGIDTSGKSTVAKKVAAIEALRERVAEVDVLGITMTIPIKRMHDKRVSDLAGKPLNDEAAEELMSLVLGEDQMAALMERVTDEDGTVDVDALGLAVAKVMTADALKNF